MFGWRKKNTSDEEKICPYCNTPNHVDADNCTLCYYEFDRSARDQPMATPSSTDSEIMSTLMSDDFEELEEEDAVEAVLTLDEVTVEVDQFEQSTTDLDTFQFIESSGPTLSETKNYQTPEEVELSNSDAPSKEVDFVVPNSNPLEEVAEPVHTGQGSLFSVYSESDFDVDEVHKTSIPIPGKTNMDPQIISETREFNEVDLSAAITQDEFNHEAPKTPDEVEEPPEVPEIPEQVTTTPEIPDIPSITDEVVETPEVPDIPEQITITPDIPDIPNEIVETPEVPEIPNESEEKIKPAPIPQHNNRIWPWPAKQPWDERQVYREVVSLLELVKNGKLVQAAEAIDKLGPHLNNNLDMLTHIGTVMRYLGREEHLQWMLKMAQTVYPNDQRVSTAITHLSN